MSDNRIYRTIASCFSDSCFRRLFAFQLQGDSRAMTLSFRNHPGPSIGLAMSQLPKLLRHFTALRRSRLSRKTTRRDSRTMGIYANDHSVIRSLLHAVGVVAELIMILLSIWIVRYVTVWLLGPGAIFFGILPVEWVLDAAHLAEILTFIIRTAKDSPEM